MDGSTVLIVGGGWGGLAAAHALRGLLAAEHRLMVLERKDAFSFCPSYLWLMTGERNSLSEVQRPMAALARPGIEWIHEEAVTIDPETRTVTTGSATIRADHLILALGAENRPEAIPGFDRSAHNLYEAHGALEIREALSRFGGGRVVVLIARTPFRCPGAPYEAAFLIDGFLRDRGIREDADIAIYTPEKLPMAVTGPAVGEALRGMLEEHGIRYEPEHMVTAVDGSSRTISFKDEEIPYHLLIGIPPHGAPKVVVEAGLTDSTGYIPVHPQTMEILADPETLETRFPGVYAIGDVASIRLLNSLLLPKTGIFAEGEATVVAANVAAKIKGERERARYGGNGGCYIEVGQGQAAYGSGDFYAYPGPRVSLQFPSAEHRRAKLELERVLQNWFTMPEVKS